MRVAQREYRHLPQYHPHRAPPSISPLPPLPGSITKDGVFMPRQWYQLMAPSPCPSFLLQLGHARPVITAQNKITRIEDIPWLQRRSLCDRGCLSYVDNNNNTPEYNEAGRLNVTFKNVGNQTTQRNRHPHLQHLASIR